MNKRVISCAVNRDAEYLVFDSVLHDCRLLCACSPDPGRNCGRRCSHLRSAGLQPQPLPNYLNLALAFVL